jgi:hypothetical protein
MNAETKNLLVEIDALLVETDALLASTAVKTEKLNLRPQPRSPMNSTSEIKPDGRPLADEIVATGHIHLTVTLARKGWYVRTARLYNQTLAEWMLQELDKSSGYPPNGRYERV